MITSKNRKRTVKKRNFDNLFEQACEILWPGAVLRPFEMRLMLAHFAATEAIQDGRPWFERERSQKKRKK